MISYLCPICGDTRPNRSRLRTHISMQHPQYNAVNAVASARKVEDVVTNIPDGTGSKSLADRVADIGARLDKAGEEVADLKAKADDVAARLEALDAGIVSPGAVRRTTLMQVWDKLMDAGNFTGAAAVMRMMDSTKEGDWS